MQSRLARKAGAHAQQSHEEHVAFSPKTREVQLDEKWSFVAKKEKNCDINLPLEKGKGDQWDHTAIDAETRLMVSVVVGRRTLDSCVTLVQAVKDKTQGRTDMFFTTDEHAAYKTAISKYTNCRQKATVTTLTRAQMKPKRSSPLTFVTQPFAKFVNRGELLRLFQHYSYRGHRRN